MQFYTFKCLNRQGEKEQQAFFLQPIMDPASHEHATLEHSSLKL